MVDQNDLARAEQSLGYCQRANDVLGDDAARVTNHVRIALRQTEDAEWIQSGVHARDHRDMFRRRHGKLALTE